MKEITIQVPSQTREDIELSARAATLVGLVVDGLDLAYRLMQDRIEVSHLDQDGVNSDIDLGYAGRVELVALFKNQYSDKLVVSEDVSIAADGIDSLVQAYQGSTEQLKIKVDTQMDKYRGNIALLDETVKEAQRALDVQDENAYGAALSQIRQVLLEEQDLYGNLGGLARRLSGVIGNIERQTKFLKINGPFSESASYGRSIGRAARRLESYIGSHPNAVTRMGYDNSSELSQAQFRAETDSLNTQGPYQRI